MIEFVGDTFGLPNLIFQFADISIDLEQHEVGNGFYHPAPSRAILRGRIFSTGQESDCPKIQNTEYSGRLALHGVATNFNSGFWEINGEFVGAVTRTNMIDVTDSDSGQVEYVESRVGENDFVIRERDSGFPREQGYTIEAEGKAEKTLRELIGEKEYVRYLANGCVQVFGDSGRIYNVYAGDRMTEVFDETGSLGQVCVIIADKKVPPTDSIIARILMIRNDEMEIYKKGNSMGGLRKPKKLLTS